MTTDDRPHGVFATRSPRRPNPIGLTVVELLSREGPLLRVRGIDMLDGTPVLDIKPYIPHAESHPDAKSGWISASNDMPAARAALGKQELSRGSGRTPGSGFSSTTRGFSP